MRIRIYRCVITSLLYLTIFSSFTGFAKDQNEELSLNEALRYAYDNNQNMINARKEIESAKARLIQAGAYPNPGINIENYGLPLELGRVQNDIEIELGQEIDILGKRNYKKKIVKSEIEILNEKLNLIWTEVALKVKIKYNELLLEYKKKELSVVNLSLTRKFIDNVQMKYKSGEVLINEYIRAKIELSRAENELLIAEKEIYIDKADLNLLLNRSPDYEFKITNELLYLKKKYDINTLVEKALSNNPELKIDMLLIDLQEKSIILYKKESISNPIISILGKEEDSLRTLGISLGIPLPIWYRNQGEIAEAKVELEKIKKQREYLQKDVELKISKAFIEAELAEKQVTLLEGSVKEVNELVRVISLQYKEGKSNFLTYLEGLMTMKTTKVSFYEAVLDYRQKIALIEKIINEDLK